MHNTPRNGWIYSLWLHPEQQQRQSRMRTRGNLCRVNFPMMRKVTKSWSTGRGVDALYVCTATVVRAPRTTSCSR